MKNTRLVLSLAFALNVGTLNAQERAADPADVESIDAIVTAVYDVISGGAGVERDWDRMRTLFIDEAQLIPSGSGPSGNGYRVSNLEEWIAQSEPILVGQGFFETEIHRVIEQFGHIAHIFSTYHARRNAADQAPFMRGINSIQLFNDGTRWWVVSIYWTPETANLRIPEEYGG